MNNGERVKDKFLIKVYFKTTLNGYPTSHTDKFLIRLANLLL